mmetsp:Transcript_14897/g.23176  ORF Transcript_14897/g.23176 Transcript_14897/m.23176 type:complete len:203 (+) Transcript_14897:709-1317(+)
MNDVATARIWRAFLHARLATKQIKPVGQSKCGFPVNMRRLLSCPADAITNCYLLACASGPIEEIVKESEAKSAARVRRATNQLRDPGTVKDFVGWYLSVKLRSLTTIIMKTIRGENCLVNNWVCFKPSQIAGKGFTPARFRILGQRGWTPAGAHDGCSILTDSCDHDDELVAFVGAEAGECAQAVRKYLEANSCQVKELELS